MFSKKNFEETAEGLIIRLKIIPNASKNEILRSEDGLKLRITAQPIENKANKALIEFFSKKLKLAKSNIKILKGELNKDKTIEIKNISEKYFCEKMFED